MEVRGSARSILLHGCDYCNQTTIHGFHYLMSGRNLCEKLLWAAIIVTGISLAGSIVHRGYRSDMDLLCNGFCGTEPKPKFLEKVGARHRWAKGRG